MDENITRFMAIQADMLNTYKKKNHDYGNAFELTMDEEGLACARIRLTDKLNRFKTITRSKAMVSDESLIDTLLDLANYAIMTADYIQTHPRHED